MATIKLRVQAIGGLPAGSIVQPILHDVFLPRALRDNPPRCKLLADARGYNNEYIECELIDPWPDAPSHWPPIDTFRHPFGG